MSRMTALVLAVLGSLYLPGQAFAQLTPPAGSAGAGNSAISGVPFGPANPRVLSDPSGIGNASLIPPLRTNSPAPPVSYGSVDSLPPSRTRVVAPSYAGASQRIISAHNVEPRRRYRHRLAGVVCPFNLDICASAAAVNFTAEGRTDYSIAASTNSATVTALIKAES